MSHMYSVITGLPCNPILNTPRTTPVSDDERAKLKKLLSGLDDEVAGMMTGIASLGSILGASASSLTEREVTSLGWLISILSSTVEGLLFIGEEGESILKRPEAEVQS